MNTERTGRLTNPRGVSNALTIGDCPCAALVTAVCLDSIPKIAPAAVRVFLSLMLPAAPKYADTPTLSSTLAIVIKLFTSLNGKEYSNATVAVMFEAARAPIRKFTWACSSAKTCSISVKIGSAKPALRKSE